MKLVKVTQPVNCVCLAPRLAPATTVPRSLGPAGPCPSPKRKEALGPRQYLETGVVPQSPEPSLLWKLAAHQGQWPPFHPISPFVASSASRQRRDRKSLGRSHSFCPGSCSHHHLRKQSTCFVRGFTAFIIFPSTLVVENLLITGKKKKTTEENKCLGNLPEPCKAIAGQEL